MPKKAAVYLLAENRLLREALIRLLSKKSAVTVVGANAHSPHIHREVIAAHPQVLLMDSSGLDSSRSALISVLRTAIRNLRIVMVDMDQDEAALLGAIRVGAVGYVLKNASASEVAEAIEAVAAGQAVCPPSLCMALFRGVMQQAATPARFGWGSDSGLSRREQETAELVRQRLTNKEIALRLNLSEQTVKNHVHRILRKLGVPNRFSLAELCETKPSEKESVLRPTLPGMPPPNG
jgi:two-component system, NarL family, response regulator DevR